MDGAGQAYVTGYRSTNFPATSARLRHELQRRQATPLWSSSPRPVKHHRHSAPRAGARPVIDGDLVEWQTLGQTLLNKDTADTIAGEIPAYADLSAGLRAAWAPDGLYFAAAITDDVLVGNNSPEIWGDDNVELSVRVGNTTHQFTVAVDGRQADKGVPITSLTVATRTVPGGWTLEVAVPAAALGLTQLGQPAQRAIPLHLRPLG